MKKLVSLVLLVSFIGCSSKNYINTKDNTLDKDEKIIKQFRANQNYSINELKNLQIKYLGEIDNYNIYYVPFKGSSGVLNENAWVKNGHTFPIESQTRIIGIKNDQLYTLGNLLNETQINIDNLYDLMPDEYKRLNEKN